MARLVRATHEHRSRPFRDGAPARVLRTTVFMGHPDKPGDDERWEERIGVWRPAPAPPKPALMNIFQHTLPPLAAARLSAARLRPAEHRLLSEAATLLASSLDVEATAAHLASLCVAEIGQ